MAEVFRSYASIDRQKAQALASFLQHRSCSVFWDRTIPPGKSFDEVIEKALHEARAVIVLWSKAAVTSDWVRAEAEDAATRRVLVPIMIEKVTVPLRFRLIQAADLSAWDFRSSTSEIMELLRSIEELVGKQLSVNEPTTELRHGLASRSGETTEESQIAEEKLLLTSNLSYLKAFRSHLLFGRGLFYVNARLKRKWLYPALRNN